MSELIKVETSGGFFQKHVSAFVDNGAKVGAQTKVWHFSHIMPGAVIGERCAIGQNSYIGARARLGSGVKVQNNVSLYDDVHLEDDVFCGPSCVFTNVINPRAFIERKTEYKKTLVKKGASIGANATIVCGVTLGEYSFVGAGAVVTKDVPDYAMVYGMPARVQGWICYCGEKLPKDYCCSECGKKYAKDDVQGLSLVNSV